VSKIATTPRREENREKSGAPAADLRKKWGKKKKGKSLFQDDEARGVGVGGGGVWGVCFEGGYGGVLGWGGFGRGGGGDGGAGEVCEVWVFWGGGVLLDGEGGLGRGGGAGFLSKREKRQTTSELEAKFKRTKQEGIWGPTKSDWRVKGIELKTSIFS